jgi:probable F420-dependent oxidoreductase
VKFWQASAFLDTTQVLDIARCCDENGYDFLTVSDHVFWAEDLKAKYPYTPTGAPFWDRATSWPDPYVTIGAMGAVTTNLRFSTNVYVAPTRDLFTVAKQVSTAAVLTGGRVTLGAAPGWCEDEFVAMGQDFSTRGKRLDEMVGVLRRLWSGDVVEHHGTYYTVPNVSISPTPATPIPVYIGGDTDVAMRRAARIGDGWVGNAYTPDKADEMVSRMLKALSDEGRDPGGFEVVIALVARPTPAIFREWEEKGVTSFICAPWLTGDPRSPELAPLQPKLDAIKRFADEVISPLR